MSILRVKTVDESLKRSFAVKKRRKTPGSLEHPSSDSSSSSTVKFDDKITILNYNIAVTDNNNTFYSSTAPAGLSRKNDPYNMEISTKTFEFSSKDGYRRSKKEMQIFMEGCYNNLRFDSDICTRGMIDVTNDIKATEKQRLKLPTQPRRRKMVEEIVKTAGRGFTHMMSMEQKRRHSHSL